jgi:lauroyl/myristoyl acyltransferase
MTACEDHLKLDPFELELQVISAQYEHYIGTIRDIVPVGLAPVTLLGLSSVEAARRANRGAVLWVSPFAHSDIVTKRALSQAGFEVTHLSHFGHPFSSTRLGARLLNPVQVHIENRYLKQRVLVSYGQAQPALEALKKVLQRNGIVTVTAIGAGRKSIELPFLSGTMRLAVGAPRLALETGAALIPVNTVPDGRGGFSVYCGDDLNRGYSGTDNEAIHAMAERYVAVLDTFVRKHPSSWQGWLSLSWRSSKGAQKGLEQQ